MRPAHLILTIAALGCSKATAGGRQQPAPVPPPANGRQDTSRTTSGRGPAQEPAPKPYNQVITAGAVTDSGVFIIHRISDKLFYEIPRSMLGREFRLVVDRRGTIRGLGYAGEQISARSVRWDRSLNSMTIPTNFSMVLLSANPMQPRLCDNRVGFFSVSYEDYGSENARAPTRCYIIRWRLEPKDPTAAVSDPVKPIVFYIDPATPPKWVPWLIKGVQAWEPVFRAAGFSNAITAKPAPTPQEDPEFDLDDARYSASTCLPSTVEK